MAEKCTRQLPAIRISETTETALMRLAARDERSLSEYIRLTLERHAFGHAASLVADDASVSGFGALQCSTDALGGRR
jgi:hypothetical protein